MSAWAPRPSVGTGSLPPVLNPGRAARWSTRILEHGRGGPAGRRPVPGDRHERKNVHVHHRPARRNPRAAPRRGFRRRRAPRRGPQPPEARRLRARALRPRDARRRRALARSRGSRARPTTTRSSRRCISRTASRGRSPSRCRVDEDGAHRLGGADAVALVASEGGEPLAVLRISEIFKRDRSKEAHVRLRDRGPRAPGREGAARCRRPLRRRHARGDRAAAARRLPAVPAEAGRDARGVRPARLADGRRLPDAEPDPPSPRVHPEVRARDRGRPAGAPAGRRDEGRRRPARRADALLRGAVRGLLPEGPRDGLGVPGGDALRGSEGGDLARDLPEELRLHPLHRRAATTPASATTTAPTTRRRSSSGSSRASSASRR